MYAEVPFARSMVLSPSGTLFVASYSFVGIDGESPQLTHVWAVMDEDGDGQADLCVPVTGALPSFPRGWCVADAVTVGRIFCWAGGFWFAEVGHDV